MDLEPIETCRVCGDFEGQHEYAHEFVPGGRLKRPLFIVQGPEFAVRLPNGNRLSVDVILDEWPPRELRLRLEGSSPDLRTYELRLS